jgi:hypothetical protein
MKMSYDKLDFSRPTAELKPHYHSTSTLKSVKSSTKSKELMSIQSSAANNNSNNSGYVQATYLSDQSDHQDGGGRRSSSGHLSKGEIPKVIILSFFEIKRY